MEELLRILTDMINERKRLLSLASCPMSISILSSQATFLSRLYWGVVKKGEKR